MTSMAPRGSLVAMTARTIAIGVLGLAPALSSPLCAQGAPARCYADLIFTSWTLERAPHTALDVYGPTGLRQMTDHLIAAYAEDIAVRTGRGGEHEGEAGPVVRVHEIGPGVVYRDSLVTVTAFLEHHGS